MSETNVKGQGREAAEKSPAVCQENDMQPNFPKSSEDQATDAAPPTTPPMTHCIECAAVVSISGSVHHVKINVTNVRGQRRKGDEHL